MAGPTPNGSDNAKRCRAIYAAMLDNLPDSTKTDIFARGTFKVDADTNWFFETSIARNHTTGRAAPSPLDGSAMRVGADGNYPRMVMPIDSRYFPRALLDRLGYTEADYVSFVDGAGRKFTEVATRSLDRGNRVSDNTNEQYRFVIGANTLMGGWDVDTALNLAQARGSLNYEGYLLQEPRRRCGAARWCAAQGQCAQVQGHHPGGRRQGQPRADADGRRRDGAGPRRRLPQGQGRRQADQHRVFARLAHRRRGFGARHQRQPQRLRGVRRAGPALHQGAGGDRGGALRPLQRLRRQLQPRPTARCAKPSSTCSCPAAPT